MARASGWTDPDQVVQQVFGFPGFRPGQRAIVDRILARTHCLCVMPTGAGKSLCYQVPALMQDGPTIVVSPLTALMDDQVAGLSANGVAAAAIHSGRDRSDNVAAWQAVAAGRTKLLYLSPERLMAPRMLAALAQLRPPLFVIDEAHCVSKWGANFRPDYEHLTALQSRFPEAVIAAFTATADAATRTDVAEKLFGGCGDIVVHGFDRPNIRLGVAAKQAGLAQVQAFLQARQGLSGIVYCLSRAKTETLADQLRDLGLPAIAYHAGMDAQTRRAHQEQFMAEAGAVMVATIAFGMGIDKADIRYVLHLNLPANMEAYYQEIGRAGRDGAPAEALMLYSAGDITQRRRFIDQDGGPEAHLRREHQRLDTLIGYCEAVTCRRAVLLSYFGETQHGDCGNCDTCLDPPTLCDATRPAQMLLSAAVRTGERFGAGHLIDIVRGRATEKVAARGHDRLPTFGVGADHRPRFWQGLARQAIAQGLLAMAEHGALRLTGTGRAVLTGEQRFAIRADTGARPERSGPGPDTQALPADTDLLTRLKALRRELAAERQVPAYVIFADAALLEMARHKPTDLDAFGRITGVGPKKLADFGDRFTALIRDQAAG
ncbi:MAG: DNA helicase RecQ [Rhodothalassiaceae bacterium]